MKRKRRIKVPTVSLPQELCTEILTRLPTKPLLRFRCVSKTWCSLIDDPHFVSSHLKTFPNNQEKSRFIVIEPPDMADARQQCTIRRNDTFRKISWLGLDVTWFEHYQVVGYINGLFCMKRYQGETILYQFFLWNPSMKKALDLPLPHMLNNGRVRLDVDFAFGYDPFRDDYKVIASLYSMGGFHVPDFVELYTVSKGFWRSISVGKLPCAWSKEGPKAFLNGVTYWMGKDITKIAQKGKFTHLVSFDVHNEGFDYTELPDCENVNDREHQRFPVVLGQSIALMDIFKTRSHIWVLEESSGMAKSWSRRYSINLSLTYGKFFHLTTDGELLFVGERGGANLYNIESGETKALAKSYRLCPVFSDVYEESLVFPTDGAHGRRIRPFPLDRIHINLDDPLCLSLL